MGQGHDQGMWNKFSPRLLYIMISSANEVQTIYIFKVGFCYQSAGLCEVERVAGVVVRDK